MRAGALRGRVSHHLSPAVALHLTMHVLCTSGRTKALEERLKKQGKKRKSLGAGIIYVPQRSPSPPLPASLLPQMEGDHDFTYDADDAGNIGYPPWWPRT